MNNDPIARLLNEDFALSRAALENDEFSERILSRLMAKRRRRLGVIGAAAGIGAIIAAAQFAKVAGLAETARPYISSLSDNAAASGLMAGMAPQLLAAAAMAVAFSITAIVLQGES